MPFPSGTDLFVLDGSGTQDPRIAAVKRPLYHLKSFGSTQQLTKVPSNTGLWVEYFSSWFMNPPTNPTWLLVDVALGLPANPSDVWNETKDFPSWLALQWKRGLGPTWRTSLIADSWASRTADRPFVKVRRGEKHLIASKRACDQCYQAESVYCIDSGAAQVGRASLQFWFECLMPLRERFPGRIAIWPFEPTTDAHLVIAECYPASCQQAWRFPKGSKRDPAFRRQCLEQVRRTCSPLSDSIAIQDWNGPAEVEDDWDVFLTAITFAMGGPETAFALESESLEKEGWILTPKSPLLRKPSA